MESIKLEQIDLIMERANVTYEEAKEALEIAKGDVVEALLYLEKAQKIKTSNKFCNKEEAGKKIKECVDKANKHRFILFKQDTTCINISLTAAVIIAILCFHVSMIGLVLALVFGYRIKIVGEDAGSPNVNFGVDDFVK